MDDLLPIPTPLKTENVEEKMEVTEITTEDIEWSGKNEVDLDICDELLDPAILQTQETKQEALPKTKKLKSTKKKSKGKPLPVIGEKSGKKGKPIPGMAREIVLKVAEVCEQEYKDGCSKYPTSAPTKRASTYTGVSVSTIRRIRVENNSKNKYTKEEDKTEVKDKIKKEVGKDKEDYKSKDKIDQKRATIPNSARDIICKVIAACDKEAQDGNFLIPFISKTKRVALYTGISESTIKRIKIEDRVRNKVNPGKTLPRPGNIRKRATCDEKLDDFDLQVIRREIDEYTLVKKSHLSIATLLNAVKEKININFCKGTLWRLLKKKGYDFRKVPGENKGKAGKIITEKPEISEARLNYLKEITKHEAEGRVIVYLDDVTFHNELEDDEEYRRALNTADKTLCSERIIMLHDHTAAQFVKKVQVLFKPNCIGTVMAPRPKCNVSIEQVEQWFKSKIFPNIPSNSVIVMCTPPKEKRDKDTEKVPTKFSSKGAMVNYLKEKKYAFDAMKNKEQLYEIIKKNVTTNCRLDSRDIDRIIKASGRTPLRLPQCLTEFHPITLAWTDIKRFIRSKQNPKSRMGTEALRTSTYEAISYFTQETWQGYVTHIIEMENYYWEKRSLFQDHINEIRKWAVDDANLRLNLLAQKKEEVPTETETENNNKKVKNPTKSFGTQTDPEDFKLLAIPSDAIIIENHATNTISIQTQTPNGLPTVTNVNIIPSVVATQTTTGNSAQKPYDGIAVDNYYFNTWYNRHVTDVAGTSQPSQPATLTPVSIDPRQIDTNVPNYQKTWIDFLGYEGTKPTVTNATGQVSNTVSGNLTSL